MSINAFQPLNTIAFAHSVALVAAAAYVICAVVSVVAPDLYLWFFQSWLHGLSLEPLRPSGSMFNLGSSLIGLLTLTATAWFGAFAVARLYAVLCRN